MVLLLVSIVFYPCYPQGALVNEIRTQILKDASKKANFPGFRKVGRFFDKAHHCDCRNA